MQPNTASRTNRGQFDDREYSTEVIYSSSDQDSDIVGWGGRKHQENTVCEPEYILIHVKLDELRVYINQTRVGDCWKSRRTNKDGYGEFYMFEWSVFYEELMNKLHSF